MVEIGVAREILSYYERPKRTENFKPGKKHYETHRVKILKLECLENITNVTSLSTLLVIVLLEEMAVEEDIGRFQILMAEVATLLENVASLIRLAALAERLVTSAENATKMI
ncbi:hypothetical protein NPIL_552501 [Nephila pilipes]|uniref:Uncharacterized protein n=1 Tax=Nephila pilipes TaxID=299642 RepID=A0A8X6MP96_NEPPI|nr:hypothetical protein NPIL_552501 [Nephila pilipes]